VLGLTGKAGHRSATDCAAQCDAGINYGMLFTAWGVASIIGPRIAGVRYDKYKNYQMAFYTAAVLAAVPRCSANWQPDARSRQKVGWQERTGLR
jgi:hypothetical protein